MTISIIVPVYNTGKYLRRCLDSILAQTFEDFEIICVDDHSTDDSCEIIKEYAQKDRRVVELENPEKGVCSARNFGIDNARGEYIGFIDSDDFVQPQMYEFMLRAIKENNCNMVVCNYRETETLEAENFEYSCREVNIEDYIGDAHNWGKDEMIVAGVWSKLVKADYLRNNARFKDFRVGQDMVFCAQLWVNAGKTMLVDLPLYGYYVYPESSCHRNYEERYISLVRARYAAYSVYSEFNRKVAEYYLYKSFFFAVRCKTENLLTSKNYKKCLNQYFVKMLIPILKSTGIGLKEKLFNIFEYIKRIGK